MEPTEDMIFAAMHCLDGVNLKEHGQLYKDQKRYKYIVRYRAMLAAAPVAAAPNSAKWDALESDLMVCLGRDLWAQSGIEKVLEKHRAARATEYVCEKCGVRVDPHRCRNETAF